VANNTTISAFFDARFRPRTDGEKGEKDGGEMKEKKKEERKKKTKQKEKCLF
jgi:hypothetical protein